METQMSNYRLFNLLVAVALSIAAALTVQEAFATASILSQADAARHANQSECASLPSHYSIHALNVKETGTIIAYTEDGPTGVDGGLINLLSNYRTCSR
jgi:hypothetical protein